MLMAKNIEAKQAVGQTVELTTGTMVGGGLLFAMIPLGAVIAALSVIPLYIILYRAWKCLQPGRLARTTPGQAIGFMFIPFFNIYWFFQAFWGLAKDWNRTVGTYPDLKSTPRLSEGLFLAYCIPPLSAFLVFPVLSQL